MSWPYGLSALDDRLSGPGSSAGLNHCVVFSGNKYNSHSASLSLPSPRNINGYRWLAGGITCDWIASHPAHNITPVGLYNFTNPNVLIFTSFWAYCKDIQYRNTENNMRLMLYFVTQVSEHTVRTYMHTIQNTFNALKNIKIFLY